MNAPRRRVVLGLALIASLAATGWVGSQEAAVEEKREGSDVRALLQTAPPRRAPSNAPAADATLALDKLQRSRVESGGADPFMVENPEPKPSKSTARAAPPAPPVPPPLPFTYVGRMSKHGLTTVFLIGGERSLAVREGDVLDGQYKVDDIGEKTLVLTYLPLQQQQVLNLAAAGER